jgi:hypothetical protein
VPRLELDQAVVPSISMPLQLVGLVNVGSNIAPICDIKAAEVACKPVEDRKEGDR